VKDDDILPGGIIRVETLGSWWLIDEVNLRYCRFPKTEGGRERPEWGDERAGMLQDAIWHEFTGRWHHSAATGLQLETHTDDNGTPIGIYAPPTIEQRADFMRQLFDSMGQFEP
jgi:hypothetical protein